jgi:hypothetical protein
MAASEEEHRMGFFDKKRRNDEEDDDDTVGQGEVLPPLPRAPAPPPAPHAPSPAHAPPSPHVSALLDAARHAVDPAPGGVTVKTAPPPPPPAEPVFGIDDAVVLMRQLPNRNIDLVMQVVKKTLESVHVDVPRIIEGATRKEAAIEDRIGVLKKEIEKLEGQIAAATKEIAALEGEEKEISTVKERLLLAQKMEAELGSDRPAAPAKAAVPPGPPPAPTVSAAPAPSPAPAPAPGQPPPPPKT